MAEVSVTKIEEKQMRIYAAISEVSWVKNRWRKPTPS